MKNKNKATIKRKSNRKQDNEQTNNEQMVQGRTDAGPQYEGIYLGLDVHADHIRVVRQIDQANAQPAQRLSWEQVIGFCQKQLTLSKKVYAVYEAGAFG